MISLPKGEHLAFLLITAFLFLFTMDTVAEEIADTRTYSIQKFQQGPRIDGDWSDDVWKQVPPTTGFLQTIPVEHAPPTFRTEVKMLYTDQAIYLAAYCFDPEPDRILRQLGTRDDDLNADVFRVDLDPYDARRDFTAFWVSASGVQGDFRYTDRNFNAVWQSEVSIQEDGWVVEMKIPFSALRLPNEETQQWSVQLRRHIRRLQEDVVWSPTRRENSNFMDYYGKLTGISDINPPVRLSVTPYLNIQYLSRPDAEGRIQRDTRLYGGADLKYGLNESFTLDMTLLPDFSQVPSDDVVNNLSAFETLYDEQRTFFQEGVDLFSKGNLFYSRRIGAGVMDPGAPAASLDPGDEIRRNPSTSRLVNAFKISGRTKKNVGIGVFNALEGRTYSTIELAEGGRRKVQTDPLSNYNILVVDKHFGNNRSIYAINTNVSRSDGFRDANVTGTGFSVNFADNRFNVRGQASYSYIRDLQAEKTNKTGYQYVLDFDRISGQWRYGWRTEAISGNYDRNDLGVIFRTNYLQHGWSTNYNKYEPFGRVRYLNTMMFLSFRQHMPTGELSSITMNIGGNTTFSKSHFSIMGGIFANLFGEKDFYEARTEGQVFRQPRFVNLYTGIQTDNRRKFGISLRANATAAPSRGGAYSLGFTATPAYRPNDHLTLQFETAVGHHLNDIGYAARGAEGQPVFGKRDIRNYSNVIGGNYIIRNGLSIGVRARHYWSRVEYEHYYELTPEGELTATLYADPEDNNHINYNSFNLDFLLNWEFAPGSALSFSYKNAVLEYNHQTEGSMAHHLRSMFGEAQHNTLSLRIVYFIDYNSLRK